MDADLDRENKNIKLSIYKSYLLITSRWTLAAVITFPFLRCISIERVFSVLCMDPMECLWISRASLHSKRGKKMYGITAPLNLTV